MDKKLLFLAWILSVMTIGIGSFYLSQISTSYKMKTPLEQRQKLGDSIVSCFPTGNVSTTTLAPIVLTDSPPYVFRDKYFAPVLESFRKAADGYYDKLPRQRFRNGSIPKVYFYVKLELMMNNWFRAHVLDILKNRCPRPCHITTKTKEVSTADAVAVHMRSLKSPEHILSITGGRDPTQPWIMFGVETHLLANSVHHIDYRTLNGFFNRTFYHRTDSDILLLHGFMVRRGKEASLLPESWRQEPIMWPVPNRTKLVATFISNCHDNSGRMAYINQLKQHTTVDVYGLCGRLNCGKRRYAQHFYSPATDPCMKLAGENYLFYLAFENSMCKDYVTEKVYNLLFYPLVPVVYGAVDYDDLLPPNSYLNARHYTPEQLAHKLHYLAAHPQEYMKYLKWRQYYQPSTVGGARILCDLCVKLYELDFYKYHVIEDFHGWYVKQANCNVTGTVRKRFSWHYR